MSAVGGWVLAMAPCYACRELFTFNPHRVPSHEGEPICSACIAIVNERRAAAGRPVFSTAGAYEPMSEEEL